ncbi:hypothetical protein ACWDGI_25940 [Streptomyces sp. NPDC001220]
MVQRTTTASGLVPPRACSRGSVGKAGAQLASPPGSVPLDDEGKLVGVACSGGAGQLVGVTATDVVPDGARA